MTDRPRRPWWQFSIKSLLIIMLVTAGYFAGWTAAMQRVRLAEMKAKEEAERARVVAERAQMQAEVAAQALANARTFQARAALDLTTPAQAEEADPKAKLAEPPAESP